MFSYKNKVFLFPAAKATRGDTANDYWGSWVNNAKPTKQKLIHCYFSEPVPPPSEPNRQKKRIHDGCDWPEWSHFQKSVNSEPGRNRLQNYPDSKENGHKNSGCVFSCRFTGGWYFSLLHVIFFSIIMLVGFTSVIQIR